jgi:hypothetical protein
MKGIRRRALAVIAAGVLVTLALSAGVVAADGRDHRNAENTFTKWVTDGNAGTMAGIVGGDVGDGAYVGQILSFVVVGNTQTIDASYGFSGRRHSFTALVHVVQTGAVPGSTAVITGIVQEGWLKGNLVAGEYTQIACDKGVESPQTCYEGTLDILRGTKPGD